MNALDLLKSDHQRISELFDQIQQAGDIDQKRDIFENVRDGLLAHSELEETLFYPLFMERPDFQDNIEEALDEHAEIKDLIDEIESLDDDSELEDRLEELKEAVDHHVNEEEQELFVKVRKIMNETELEELGERMAQAKQAPPRAA